jgi:hypothetical protein
MIDDLASLLFREKRIVAAINGSHYFLKTLRKKTNEIGKNGCCCLVWAITTMKKPCTHQNFKLSSQFGPYLITCESLGSVVLKGPMSLNRFNSAALRFLPWMSIVP